MAINKLPRLILPDEFFDEKQQTGKLPDIATFVHQRIKISLQSARIPWKVPVSHDPNCGLPCNVRTGNRYRGVNTVLLCDTFWTREFRSRWWGTAEDWEAIGAAVKNGATPTVITRHRNEGIFDIEPCLVYNAKQVSGADHYQQSLSADDSTVAYDEVDFGLMGMLLEHHSPDIRYDVGDEQNPPDRDAYVPPDPWHEYPNHKSGDYILMQSERHFHSRADHYSVMLHELMHWAEVRTGWFESLAAREFVAEAGMHILGSELAVPHTFSEFNHRQWMRYWNVLFHKDDKFLFSAMAQVDRACDFLLTPVRNGEAHV